jgi:hypothetical protein
MDLFCEFCGAIENREEHHSHCPTLITNPFLKDDAISKYRDGFRIGKSGVDVLNKYVKLGYNCGTMEYLCNPDG